MITFLSDCWQRLESTSAVASDTPEQRRRKGTLVVVAILSCMVAAITMANSYRVTGLTRDVWVPAAYVAVVGLALLVFLWSKRFGVLLYAFLVMMLCGPLVFQAVTGGLAAVGTVSIAFWSLLAPLGAMMFDRVSRAVVWLAAYLVLLGASLLMDGLFAPFFVPIAPTETLVNQAINLCGFSITVFLSMAYFVHASETEHARSEGLVVELTDTLSQLHATQAELVQAEKLASLGKLAAGIAHELNNPVGALKSSADNTARCVAQIEELLAGAAEQDAPPDHDRLLRLTRVLRTNSEVLLSAGDRVTRTVDSLVEFTRLDVAAIDRVDLHRGLDSALELIHNEIGQGVQVMREYGDLPAVECHAGQLNQVFMSLLTNAAQATGAEGAITIRTHATEGEVHVEVSDTGPGIADDDLGAVFDPGFRSDGERVRGGMGLFASAHIVRQHGGRIEVTSTPGAGSTFTVVLPVALPGG